MIDNLYLQYVLITTSQPSHFCHCYRSSSSPAATRPRGTPAMCEAACGERRFQTYFSASSLPSGFWSNFNPWPIQIFTRSHSPAALFFTEILVFSQLNILWIVFKHLMQGIEMCKNDLWPFTFCKKIKQRKLTWVISLRRSRWRDWLNVLNLWRAGLHRSIIQTNAALRGREAEEIALDAERRLAVAGMSCRHSIFPKMGKRGLSWKEERERTCSEIV